MTVGKRPEFSHRDLAVAVKIVVDDNAVGS